MRKRIVISIGLFIICNLCLISQTPDEYFNDGLNNINIGNYDKAIEKLQKSFKGDIFDALVNFNIGYAYTLKGSFLVGITYLNKSILQSPSFAKAYFVRGLAKGNLSRFEEGILDLTKAIELKPLESIYYYYRGNFEGNKEKYLEALKDFNTAISIDRNKVEYYISRAIAKESIGDNTGAAEDRRIALDIQSKKK